eukprot:4477890-Prymnesium_polylepis.2
MDVSLPTAERSRLGRATRYGAPSTGCTLRKEEPPWPAVGEDYAVVAVVAPHRAARCPLLLPVRTLGRHVLHIVARGREAGADARRGGRRDLHLRVAELQAPDVIAAARGHVGRARGDVDEPRRRRLRLVLELPLPELLTPLLPLQPPPELRQRAEQQQRTRAHGARDDADGRVGSRDRDGGRAAKRAAAAALAVVAREAAMVASATAVVATTAPVETAAIEEGAPAAASWAARAAVTEAEVEPEVVTRAATTAEAATAVVRGAAATVRRPPQIRTTPCSRQQMAPRTSLREIPSSWAGRARALAPSRRKAR